MLERILLLYTDKYYLVKQVYPFGLDLIADYLRRHSYNVTVEFPYFASTDLETNIAAILERVNPDLIGLGLRNIDTCMSCEQYGNYEDASCRAFYFLPQVKQIVETIKKFSPDVPVIAGGGAFSVSPAAILKELDIKYGIVGEGEEPMRQFLETFPDENKIAKIPNMVVQDNNSFHVNPRLPYSFKKIGQITEREAKFNYAYETAGLPVQVKRGCNQNCSYCVEPIIEGRKIIFREHDDVIKELSGIAEKYDEIRKIFFVDTEFNIPDFEYCSILIRKILEAGLHEHFRFSSQFLPRPFDEEFAGLLAEAGFSIVITCDSFADSILETNGVSYRQNDIEKTIELCEQFNIDCTLNLIFGLPGETFETIDHTLKEMMKFPPHFLRRYEYTLGGRIYQGTPLCRFVDKQTDCPHLYGKKSEGYLEPYFYCSPESPPALKEYIEGILPFSMEFNNNYDSLKIRNLAIVYLADQAAWDEAEIMFYESDIATQVSVYDYIFRRLVNSGRKDTARVISEHLIAAIADGGENSEYMEQVLVIQYYLSLLAT